MANPTAGPSMPSIKPPVVQPGSGNAIRINPCQRQNPILECIRNVSKEFGDIVPDFQLGRTTCALFLSLKYHRLHPEYIHDRIQKLGNMYNLRILLLMCDISEHQEQIRELTKTCLINNITVIVCWSPEEAGMYLSTYKAFEHKPPDLIKERIDKDYQAILRSALTSINKVNKMDVETLRTSFGSFAKIARASPEQLRNLPGFGPVKVRRMKDAFEKPFRNKATSAISGTQQGQTYSTQTDDLAAQDEEELLAALRSDNIPAPNAGGVDRQIVHSFGSAADMPPPPQPPQPTPAHPTERESGPSWDIVLDLNDDVQNGTASTLDPRLTCRQRPTDGDADEIIKDKAEGTTAKRRTRSPSPVWDIELDLNDD